MWKFFNMDGKQEIMKMYHFFFNNKDLTFIPLLTMSTRLLFSAHFFVQCPPIGQEDGDDEELILPFKKNTTYFVQNRQCSRCYARVRVHFPCELQFETWK
jgi:hypothetical protein